MKSILLSFSFFLASATSAGADSTASAVLKALSELGFTDVKLETCDLSFARRKFDDNPNRFFSCLRPLFGSQDNAAPKQS